MRTHNRCVRTLTLLGLLPLLSACSDGVQAGDLDGEELASRRASRWVQLGGSLNPDPTDYVSAPALLPTRRVHPALAFSSTDPISGEEETRVLRWQGSGWEPVGEPLDGAGPALDGDGPHRLYACTGGGPSVRRWDGTSWAALGGDISEETGYRGTRYQVSGCSDLLLDRSAAPLVVWTADVGAKAHAVYAARWDAQRQRWEGLGPSSLGVRAPTARAAIDPRDRLYVATYSPGGSYGGGATTRVWRWSRGAWTQLGGDLPDTSDPTIAVHENSAYLALHDNPSGELRVLQWQRGAWRSLPSLSSGSQPALAFTASGRPVLGYVDPSVPAALRVDTLERGVWVHTGPGVSDVNDQIVGALDLSLDRSGRPMLAWSEQDADGARSHLRVKRYSLPLP